MALILNGFEGCNIIMYLAIKTTGTLIVIAAKFSNELLTVTFMQCVAMYVAILCDTFRGGCNPTNASTGLFALISNERANVANTFCTHKKCAKQSTFPHWYSSWKCKEKAIFIKVLFANKDIFAFCKNKKCA